MIISTTHQAIILVTKAILLHLQLFRCELCVVRNKEGVLANKVGRILFLAPTGYAKYVEFVMTKIEEEHRIQMEEEHSVF